MSKKYLVTGAAGFIASKVSFKLLDRGNQVVGVDNLNDYYDVRLKECSLQQLENHSNAQNFYFETGYRKPGKLKKFIQKSSPFNAVFNLATSRGSSTWPHVYLSTNAEGTLNLLECMRENG